jgi:L,D-transpeptidase catalytic domain/Putative peptidoglycan binding domain
MAKSLIRLCVATVLGALVVGGLPVAAARAADQAQVTLNVESTRLTSGQSTKVSGSVLAPNPGAGAAVSIERLTPGGWVALLALTTDANGAFRGVLRPATSLVVRATVPAVQSSGTPVIISVRPALQLPKRVTADYPGGSSVRWRVAPDSYDGTVRVVDPTGAQLGAGRASGGWVRLRITPTSLGTFPITVQLGATTVQSGLTRSTTLVSRGPRLTRGDQGPIVRDLLVKLGSLHYHTPGLTQRYTKRVSDVVLAFQKYRRLPRTGVMNARTWRALSTASPVTPRYKGRGVHIEVDKTRQVLLLVRNGQVLGTIHVSTGATGNTPVGRFRIYTMGTGGLFRFMGFIGNYGIHGYIPVPAYPASHGCVREPMWTANWTYRHSTIGTRVIIYT